MNVKEQVKTYFQEEMFVDDIGDDDSLLGTGAMDSTGMFELVAFLETAFDVTIDSTEVQPSNIDSINNIEQFINRKRGK